ncbi:MAG: 2-hydroxyacyl-CoA dehydratase [Hyphomonadaceae bacterium]|nr:2-hydroxyacyl-CoA dehydratase [Hyphomonadaceae bacterium]
MADGARTDGRRSTKVLECTQAATAYQREYVKSLQERVIEKGEPFAIVQADTPHEIFHAMDIPMVTNQWWASYIAAKQLSGRYFEVLDRVGFPSSACRYCSLGLACTLDNDPKTAPWGGLPRPTVLVARLTCDCIQRVFQLWADALGSRFYPLEAPGWEHKDTRWFEHNREDWESVYGSERIDLLTEEMKGLIRLLESETGRVFDNGRLTTLMEQINEQELLLGEAAELVTRTHPCPVGVADQMPNVMIPQWHRGSAWAVAHARRFRDEVKARVATGAGLVEKERIRIMWIGAGVWHDPGFYNALEERHGAVFVWSMYLPFAGAKYVRFKLDDPLRALASRICSMNEVLHLPPWMNEWMVSEAKACGVDAAVILAPATHRMAVSGTKITRNALESAGVPVFMIEGDMVDGSKWRHDDMVSAVSAFLTERVEPAVARREQSA